MEFFFFFQIYFRFIDFTIGSGEQVYVGQLANIPRKFILRVKKYFEYCTVLWIMSCWRYNIFSYKVIPLWMCGSNMHSSFMVAQVILSPAVDFLFYFYFFMYLTVFEISLYSPK